jgi:hypothetical protein
MLASPSRWPASSSSSRRLLTSPLARRVYDCHLGALAAATNPARHLKPLTPGMPKARRPLTEAPAC